MAIIAGSSMLLSGGATISSSVFSETKTHPLLTTTLMITAAGFATLGGISGAIVGTTQLSGNLGRIVASSLAVLTGSTEMIKSTYAIELADMQASQELRKKAQEIDEVRLTSLQNEWMTCLNEATRMFQTLSGSVSDLLKSSREITMLSGPLGPA